MLDVPVLLRASTDISCDGKAQYSTLCRKAVRSTHHWNAAVIHLMMPSLLINKIKVSYRYYSYSVILTSSPKPE